MSASHTGSRTKKRSPPRLGALPAIGKTCLRILQSKDICLPDASGRTALRGRAGSPKPFSRTARIDRMHHLFTMSNIRHRSPGQSPQEPSRIPKISTGHPKGTITPRKQPKNPSKTQARPKQDPSKTQARPKQDPRMVEPDGIEPTI